MKDDPEMMWWLRGVVVGASVTLLLVTFAGVWGGVIASVGCAALAGWLIINGRKV